MVLCLFQHYLLLCPTLIVQSLIRSLVLLRQLIGNRTIARDYGVSAMTVRACRSAFADDGLKDWDKVKQGRGRKPSIPVASVVEIVRMTTQETPKGETHWSTRALGQELGVSHSTVHRVWTELGLKPHRVDTFKVSNDPAFDDKVIDVVGLYMNPPHQAVVLAMDEKSSVQALDRT